MLTMFSNIKKLTMIGWTIAIIISLALTAYTQRQYSLETAKNIAGANFNKDQAFRKWASSHGGVYVPIDMKRTPPSPYLAHIPNRDITTTTGKKYTLMNPAYMLRQLMEEYDGLYGAKGHITALEILNPLSKPDSWEEQALLNFQKDSKLEEISELIKKDNKSYMRLIRPMGNGPSCLKCHSHQKSYIGTKTAGGVSVIIPMQDIYALEQKSLNKIIFIHLIFWLVGLYLFYYVHTKEEHAKAKTQELLKDAVFKSEQIESANKKLTIQQRELDKKAKDLELSSKYKSDFLANMSHEIRTPLNAIIGFIDLTKKQNKDPKIDEYMNVITNSSKNLLEIIEDILDFSKIENGKLAIDKINFNLKEELNAIIKLFELKCSDKNINLITEYNKNIPSNINADSLRIKQVLSNLLSNAIKFTNENKNIFVYINYNNSILYISVKDQGKGIHTDKLDHIFKSFNQEDNSTTRKFGGTGLGLSISKALTKLMGGDLEAKSKLGEGSEFSFFVPAPVAKDLNKEVEKTQTTNFNNKKVLVVEDNKSNQLLMQIILDEMEFETIDIANDGLLGLEAFKNNDYDVILMDENMPNMNGIESTKLMIIHELENNLTHTPVIALTANAIKGDRNKFLAAGMDEYLSKPVDVKKLNTVLKKFL